MPDHLLQRPDDIADRLLASLINSLAEQRQLIEHREEIEALTESDRDGALQDALALAIHANQRDRYR